MRVFVKIDGGQCAAATPDGASHWVDLSAQDGAPVVDRIAEVRREVTGDDTTLSLDLLIVNVQNSFPEAMSEGEKDEAMAGDWNSSHAMPIVAARTETWEIVRAAEMAEMRKVKVGPKQWKTRFGLGEPYDILVGRTLPVSNHRSGVLYYRWYPATGGLVKITEQKGQWVEVGEMAYPNAED